MQEDLLLDTGVQGEADVLSGAFLFLRGDVRLNFRPCPVTEGGTLETDVFCAKGLETDVFFAKGLETDVFCAKGLFFGELLATLSSLFCPSPSPSSTSSSSLGVS